MVSFPAIRTPSLTSHRSSGIVQEMRILLGRLKDTVAAELPVGGRMPADMRYVLVETLTAATSRTKDAQYVQLAEALLPPDADLSPKLALWKVQSQLARKNFRLDESDHIANRCLREVTRNNEDMTIIAKCNIVSMHLSLAENAILRNEFERAECYANDAFQHFGSGVRPMSLVRQAQTVLGRAARYQGKFESAAHILGVCGDYCKSSSDAAVSHVQRQLADVLVEESYRKGDVEYLSRAEQILDQELAHSRIGQTTRRRLLLSKANVFVGSGRTRAAQEIFEQIDHQFSITHPQEPSDELDHVHARLKVMTIHQNQGNLEWLEGYVTKTLEIMDGYPSFTESNFYKGQVLKFRSLIWQKRALMDISAAGRCQAGPRHFIVGGGTSDVEELNRCQAAVHDEIGKLFNVARSSHVSCSSSRPDQLR